MAKITLIQLEMLVAAVDAGSFSAAGVELGCTQSRISHGIGELEERLHAQLLVRSRNGCSPTPVGHAVLGKAREMLRMANEIQFSAERDRASITGHVGVACARSVGTHLIPHVVEALAMQHPGIHVEIFDGCHDYSSVASLIGSGTAQVGISRGPIPEHFVCREFVSDSYVVVVPADAKLQSPVCWDELARLPYIAVDQPGAMWIVERCRAAGFKQQPGRRLANESAILALVARGLGFSILPRLAAFPDMAATRALHLPFPAARALVAFAERSAARLPAVRTVMQSILDRESMKKTEAWRAKAISWPE